MEVFVARQPILKLNEEVYAYELLYRDSHVNRFTAIDASRATTEVLVNSFLTIGLDRLSQNKPCFINFTEKLLLDQIPKHFNPAQLIVEILEDVSFSDHLVEECRDLKEQGYTIALDDVVSLEQLSNLHLLRYIDIIKVDIRSVSPKQRHEIIHLAKTYNLTLLAEKVETREEHQACVLEGFELFQGFYYSKPHVVSGVDIPFFTATYFQIIEELSVSGREVDVDKVVDILEQDLALTYKLLRLINSSNYQHSNVPIQSIKQAVMLLGTDALKKWLYVLSIEQTERAASTASQFLVKTSLLRAKMCEQVAIKLRAGTRSDGFFLTGFLSLVDVGTKQTTSEAIQSLPLDAEIKSALNGERNLYRSILDIAIAMETAEFEILDHSMEELGIDFSEIFEIYGQAIAWADRLYQEHFSETEDEKTVNEHPLGKMEI
ncbi:EAL and HDOD domain-containing protein [Halobacillus sp. K22]|uniref:EAL and HDOD domain-containing protein n=1 Tax=Halobacillus sp. K22 TaxID=3457431 RepID=UPI003FCC3F88